jgi:hypothetical protein
MFLQVMRICEELNTVNLNHEDTDKWSWSWDPKGVFTTVMLVALLIWCERNARIFDKVFKTINVLQIKSKMR